MNRSKNVRIAVIDTYVNIESDLFKDIPIHISDSCKRYDVNNSLHGTAVCSQIISKCKDVELTIYPVFCNEDFSVEPEKIIEVLDYIRSEEKYDLINMSFGVIDSLYAFEFESICKKIAQNGTIIVAAYDNNGAMSYPAACSNVIGIDVCEEMVANTDYEYIINGKVDIRGSSRAKRINLGDKYIIASGTSFLTPVFTGLIAQIIVDYKFEYTYKNVHKELMNRAKKIIKYPNCEPVYGMPYDIKKAIVFPINKENNALIRFSNDLTFEIVDFYDFKHLLHVGKKASDYLKIKLKKDYVIKNVENIEWSSDFDSVIIGHINKIIDIIGDNIIIEIIRKCIEYDKKIIAYDDFIYKRYIVNFKEFEKVNIFYPKVTTDMIPKGRYGKLWYIGKPILEVLGTRTQLGKFTIQQKLRKIMKCKGYNVGYLSTEPSGYLFGADATFPYGYNSCVKLGIEEYVPVVNEMLHMIEQKGKDIIITGGQSGTVPYDLLNMSRILLPQIAYIYATSPDAVILCVSCDDDIQYIKRTVEFIESSCETTVISLVAFPIIKEMYFIGQFKDVNIEGTNEYDNVIRELNKELKIPVFGLSYDELSKCAEVVIEYLSEK